MIFQQIIFDFFFFGIFSGNFELKRGDVLRVHSLDVVDAFEIIFDFSACIEQLCG